MAYSFSKSHSIPGERIGYLAVNPDCPNARGAGRGALACPTGSWASPTRPSLWQHVIARCLDAVVDVEPLRAPPGPAADGAAREGLRGGRRPEGTFYLFPRTPGGDDEAFVRARRWRTCCCVVPGGTFGRAGSLPHGLLRGRAHGGPRHGAASPSDLPRDAVSAVHRLAHRRRVDRIADDVQDIDPVLEVPHELLPAPALAADDEHVEIEGARLVCLPSGVATGPIRPNRRPRRRAARRSRTRCSQAA